MLAGLVFGRGDIGRMLEDMHELRWDIGRILDMIIDHGIQRGLRECLKIVAGINWKNAG